MKGRKPTLGALGGSGVHCELMPAPMGWVTTLQVNPDTPSTATLANAYGDALLLTSKGFGPHTNQISYAQAAGTSTGKKLTLSFEGMTEIHDNIGGEAMLSLRAFMFERVYLGPQVMPEHRRAHQVVAAGQRRAGHHRRHHARGRIRTGPQRVR